MYLNTGSEQRKISVGVYFTNADCLVKFAKIMYRFELTRYTYCFHFDSLSYTLLLYCNVLAEVLGI